MNQRKELNPQRVFHYFEEISRIPRESGNMQAISDYCVNFARIHQLRFLQDDAKNVIIFKPGSCGYEESDTVILQGHLDMVCQKTEDSSIDFEKDGLCLTVEGEYLTAKDTTLGADNGIAVAMMLAVLEDDTLLHPPLEAVFTTDEEVGMLGAAKLPFCKLSGKMMINMDAEEQDSVTVSCAGGSDFMMHLPVTREKKTGTKVTIALGGLQGGHSGVEIHQGRVNAAILSGRILNKARQFADIRILSADSGTKGNAIPLAAAITVVVQDAPAFVGYMEQELAAVKQEISDREEGFFFSISCGEPNEELVMNAASGNRLVDALLSVPNGVMEMSVVIDGLVETSLNLGILRTEGESIFLQFALRSNKKTAMEYLEERLAVIANTMGASYTTGGYYPPWELNRNSKLQKLYQQVYRELCGREATAVAIHAGLECAVFVANVPGLDCIAVGPELLDVHTVKERLHIGSVKETYDVILKLLEKLR